MTETGTKLQPKIEKRPPEYFAVVHRPKLDQPQRMGAFILAYQIDHSDRPQSNNVQAQVELGVLTLKEGCTFIPYTIWQAAMVYGQNVREVERMQGVGAIALFTPDNEIISNDTTDFLNIGAAVSVVSFCNDARWLEKSRNRDKRLEVDKAIEGRLEELAEKTKKPSQPFPMGQFI